jgi:hypothetical protein
MKWLVLAGCLAALIGMIFLWPRPPMVRLGTVPSIPVYALPQPSYVPPNVLYEVETSSEPPPYGTLRATEDDKTYTLMGRSKETCMGVLDQKDFDGNGFVDALVVVHPACGGSCCPNTFFFVSAQGGGKFKIGATFGESWGDPTIEKWNDAWSVLVSETNDGITTDARTEVQKRFVLKAGKAVMVEEKKRTTLKSLVELKSEDFDTQKREETRSIEFDLDGDGKPDKITGKLSGLMNRWDWGTLEWTVEFSSGKSFHGQGCRRIGVLEGSTGGVHDLVCDQDSVYRWDGSEYKN